MRISDERYPLQQILAGVRTDRTIINVAESVGALAKGESENVIHL
jgi:hypothetical protein